MYVSTLPLSYILNLSENVFIFVSCILVFTYIYVAAIHVCLMPKEARRDVWSLELEL